MGHRCEQAVLKPHGNPTPGTKLNLLGSNQEMRIPQAQNHLLMLSMTDCNWRGEVMRDWLEKHKGRKEQRKDNCT